MRTIQLIYNEINKNGKYRSIYYDIHGSHDNEGSFLKIIEYRQMILFELSTEQIDQMFKTIRVFINALPHYHYKEFENANIDSTLLVSITDNESNSFDHGVRYYNWQNTTSVPIGIENLLKYFDNVSKP